MRQLFKAAFQNRNHRYLVSFIVIAICLLTFASQMEIFVLGVIAKKGPDFFELFAPVKQGKLVKVDTITKEEMETRWNQIAENGKIDQLDTKRFLQQWKSSDKIQQAINFIDHYVPISGNLRNVAFMLLFVAIFKAITLFIYRFSTRLLAIWVSRDLRQVYFEHIQSLPMEFYQRYNIGSLSTRVVGDASMIAVALNACLVNYLQTPFTVISTLILCFFTSRKLSLIVFLGLPAIFLPIMYIAKKVRQISRQIQRNQEHFASILIDFLAGVQTVKMFALEDFSLKKYREQNHRMANLEKRSARYDLASRPVVHTIAMTFLSISMMYGLYVLHMSVPEIFFFCGLLYVFYEPVKKFAEQNAQIQRGLAATERMYEVLEIKPKIQDQKDAKIFEKFENEITFDHVSFKYSNEWVLNDVSFTVHKGETVAIVGPTGAGKSTLVQLLPRLYDVQKGEIRIDGKPITTYTQRSLRENIAFVPQKPFLFLDTIAKNIAFGRNFSQQQIEDAAKKAHADEFIQKLPDGYQTLLSETGKNLSGGQQQRLAIARALVKKAPILIMDEATSSLDMVSENLIKSAIQKLRGEITQIIIAHRLSTIEDADKILYLEQGKVVAEGTKNELLHRCAEFREMWNKGKLT